MIKKFIVFWLALLQLSSAFSQNTGQFSGSFQSTSHYYLQDKVLANIKPENPLASNNYILLNYINGPISGAIQYEAYMPPLSGYPYQLEGNRLTNRYFRFTKEMIDITAGNFFEQFGNGIIFRAFESRELGINNSLDGIRVVLSPANFIKLTGIYGKQKKYLDNGNSFIRGLDADIMIDSLLRTSIGLKFGAGIISRYEPYTGSATDFPATVNALGLRASLSRKKIEINSELALKSKDPSLTNQYNYLEGAALLMNGSYTTRGFGLFFSVRFLDNMDFRSERDSEGNYLMMNYLPSNTKQHSYMLTNIYPYSTQSSGEMSLQGELNYTFPKNSFPGGKYGTGVKFNFSQARSLAEYGGNGSKKLLSAGKEIYFQDINFEISKKWSSAFKSTLSFINIRYNKSVIEAPGSDFVKSSIAIADLQFRITPRLSFRNELQHLWTRQDHRNWIGALGEIGFSPNWSVFVSDMIDYQYSQKAHYLNTGVGYSIDYMRISFGYGRQREGQICAGGICQRVPSYKGFNLKLNVSF